MLTCTPCPWPASSLLDLVSILGSMKQARLGEGSQLYATHLPELCFSPVTHIIDCQILRLVDPEQLLGSGLQLKCPATRVALPPPFIVADRQQRALLSVACVTCVATFVSPAHSCTCSSSSALAAPQPPRLLMHDQLLGWLSH